MASANVKKKKWKRQKQLNQIVGRYWIGGRREA